MKKRNFVIAFVFILAIAFFVYTFVAYGGKPITEVPTWAIWLLFGK